MRYGLIGCGGIGVLRARALGQTPGAQIVALFDRDTNRSSQLAQQVPADVMPAWSDLLAREDIDAVVVSTPPDSHAELTIAALRAGKHVLCEKPLARNSHECQAMLEAAQGYGRFLATGFNYRFYPSVVKAREILTSGRIGELDHIRSYAGYTAADHSQSWLHEASVMGGGALRDNGIHLIDLTAFFLGNVVEAEGYISGDVWGFDGIEDNGFLILRNQDGRVASLQASWTEWKGYCFLLEIYGSKGLIQVSCFPMRTQVQWAEYRGGKTRSKTFNFYKVFLMEHLRSYRWIVEQSFIAEFTAFRSAIAGQPSLVATGEDGAHAIQIAETARWYKKEKAITERFPSSPIVVNTDSQIDTVSRETLEDVNKTSVDLSIVVVVLKGGENLRRCLEALRPQLQSFELEGYIGEVIIVADEKLTDLKEFSVGHPQMTVEILSGRKTYAALRSRAVQLSRGRIVVITEDHCIPDPDWCLQIMTSHSQAYSGIGGAVEKEAPDSALNWAVYFADYLRYMKPLSGGLVHSLTDLNAAYKRTALDEIKEAWKDEFHENEVNELLQRSGKLLWLTPNIVVHQQRNFRLAEALADRFAFGRLFASTRVRMVPLSKRFVFIFVSLLVPILLLYRTARQIMQKNRYVYEYLSSFPFLVLLSIFWGLGEMVGYITGVPGKGLRN